MPDVEVHGIPQQEAHLGDIVGRVADQRRFVGQGHALAAQVLRLADRRGHEFATGTGLQDPRRHADAELVRVGDPVHAEISVHAVQAHEIQVRQDRVEHGQPVLVAIGDVHVEQPRLERLQAGATAVHLALEVQPGVDTRHRHGSARALVLAGEPVLQLVARVIDPDAGLHEPARPLDRQLEPGCDVQAPARRTDVAIEVDQLGVDSRVESQRQ